MPRHKKRRRRRSTSSSSTQTHIRNLHAELTDGGASSQVGVQAAPSQPCSEPTHEPSPAHHEDAGEGGSPIVERAEVPSVLASMDQQDQADEEDSAPLASLLIAQPLPPRRAVSHRLLVKTVDLPHRFLASASAETRHSLQDKIPRPAACSGTDVFVTLTDIRAFLSCDDKVGGIAAKGWHEILSLAYPEWADEPVEQMLLFLVLRCKTYRRTNPETSLQMIEYWAGTGNLTQQHINLGIRSSRFDTKYSEQHDCTSPMGLRLWLEELCRTAELSLTWLGTTCSSFVALCLAQSQRKESNGYRGDETRAFVRVGNQQMLVASLLFFLSSAMGNLPMLEQPSQSVLPLLEPLAGVLKFTAAVRTITWMGSFAGESPKPLQLWHIHSVYRQLRRPRPGGALRAGLSALTTRRGQQFSGKPRMLKRSQAYTPEFAAAVSALTATVLGLT